MLGFQTKVLVRRVCSNKAEFSFLPKRLLFDVLMCTKLTFGLSDILVNTVIA